MSSSLLPSFSSHLMVWESSLETLLEFRGLGFTEVALNLTSSTCTQRYLKWSFVPLACRWCFFYQVEARWNKPVPFSARCLCSAYHFHALSLYFAVDLSLYFHVYTLCMLCIYTFMYASCLRTFMCISFIFKCMLLVWFYFGWSRIG